MKIINSYLKDSFSGFGDFLRGSIYLFGICKENNLEFGLSFCHHPISDFLIFKENEEHEQYLVDCIPLQYSKTKKEIGFHEFCNNYINNIINVVKDVKGGKKYIFSNFHDCLFSKSFHLMNKINSLTLDPLFCEWFKNNLIFNEDVESFFDLKLKHFNIKKDFCIFHFRFGDIRCFSDENNFENHFDPDWSPDFSLCFGYCVSQLNSDINTPIIIASDSNEFKSYVEKKAKELRLPIFIAHKESGHTQKNTGESLNHSLKSYFHTAVDMKFITEAKNVKSFSVYYWGSGFSSWIAKIYGIPFSCKPLMKPLN